MGCRDGTCRTIQPDENFGGMLLGKEQLAPHLAKEHLTKGVGTEFPPANHPLTPFWLAVDIDAVRARVRGSR